MAALLDVTDVTLRYKTTSAVVFGRGYRGSLARYIGCYAIVAGRWFFEADPERVVAAIERDPRFGTDRMASALLDFGHGRQLAFTVSTQSAHLSVSQRRAHATTRRRWLR